MIVEHETAWRVWYLKSMNQWVVAPPDGHYRDGEWVYLTNTYPTYWPTSTMAWKRARTCARKSRSRAMRYAKDGRVLEHPDYSTRHSWRFPETHK